MNENNRNWENQSNQDWNNNHNRSWQDENRNRQHRSGYGNSSYGNAYNQNQGMMGDYDNTGAGAYSSDYGNPYGGGMESMYGNRYGQPQNAGGSYGNQLGHQNERNQHNMGSAGLYGGDFGQESRRSDYGSTNRYGGGGMMGMSAGNDYGGSGYGGGSNYDRSYSGEGYGNAGYLGNPAHGGRQQNYGGSQQRTGGGNDRGWWDRTRDEVSSWFGDDDAERRRRMDEQRTGMHRGKGPKGYKRSEDRIREDICERLSDDDRLDATNIEIQLQGDEVILTGNVSDREQKRRAEDLVESISGVRHVENRIRVGSTTDNTSNFTTSNSGKTGSLGLT